jgi:hypothetical protein
MMEMMKHTRQEKYKFKEQRRLFCFCFMIEASLYKTYANSSAPDDESFENKRRMCLKYVTKLEYLLLEINRQLLSSFFFLSVMW